MRKIAYKCVFFITDLFALVRPTQRLQMANARLSRHQHSHEIDILMTSLVCHVLVHTSLLNRLVETAMVKLPVLLIDF